jgi:hypothetical protein
MQRLITAPFIGSQKANSRSCSRKPRFVSIPTTLPSTSVGSIEAPLTAMA